MFRGKDFPIVNKVPESNQSVSAFETGVNDQCPIAYLDLWHVRFSYSGTWEHFTALLAAVHAVMLSVWKCFQGNIYF